MQRTHNVNLLEEVERVNLLAPPPRKAKKMEDGERVIGLLTLDLPKHWRLLEISHTHIESMSENIIDHLMVWEEELTIIREESIRNRKTAEYKAKMDTFCDQLTAPSLKHAHIYQAFWDSVRKAFPEAVKEDLVLGIREGNVVISRKNDDRDDAKGPLMLLGNYYRKLQSRTRMEMALEQITKFLVTSLTMAAKKQ